MGPADNLLLVPLLCGPVFMVAGLLMHIFPPRKINGLYGYRTPASMENQERWEFSQKYAAKELIKLGAILSVASALGFLFEPGNDASLYFGLGLMVLIIVILFIRVEKAIKNRFSGS